MNENKIISSEKIKVYFCLLKTLKELNDGSEFKALQDYIIEQHGFNRVDEANQSEAELIVAFAKMKDFQNEDVYKNFVKTSTIRQISPFETQILDGNYNPKPMIIIGLEDITAENPDEDELIKKLKLNLCYRFWDSSIWHRYVSLNEEFEDRLNEVINETKKNIDNGLYQTNVAQEFLEFQMRMMVNSYLPKLGAGSHATDITPYKFHSETLMKHEADKLEKNHIYPSNLMWKFLLADDFAEEPLNPLDKSSKLTKGYIIENIIKTNKCKNSNKIYKIDPVSENIIQATFDKVEKSMYDIILLDYLLDDPSGGKDRKLGSEFLSELKEKLDPSDLDKNPDKKLNENKGPLDKFWIFPISVFPYAMHDDLHREGIRHFEPHWVLARGADPVNTPYLFKYNLYRFMGMQIHEANPIRRTRVNPSVSPEESLQFFLIDAFEGADNISHKAKACYPDFIKLFSNYKMLCRDQNRESLFAKKMVALINVHEAVWEHLHHLIYLLAYGTVINWPEMWEEYIFLKNHLKFDPTSDDEREESIQGIFNKFRDYIINLQSQAK